jgi:hypothetical protein
MTGVGDWFSLARPILSLVADLITAIDEQKAGRNGSADFIRCGSDLIYAVGQTHSALTTATSGGKSLAPTGAAIQNISGLWLNSEANIYAYHDHITGLLVLRDGDYDFIGGVQPVEDFTQFVVTGQSSDGVNLLWHGVAGPRYVVTTLWNWDNKYTTDVRFERQHRVWK